MKFTPLLALAIVFATRSGAAAEVAPPGRAEVVFDHPERYTDVKDSYNDTERGRRDILDELRQSIITSAKYLPEGDKIALVFTDVDLAGDFEPWRGPNFDDVRIVKSIYPPAFKFSYKITDASGRVVKEGTERVRDINFESRINIDREDRLHYEKDMLKEWMQRTVRDLKKP